MGNVRWGCLGLLLVVVMLLELLFWRRERGDWVVGAGGIRTTAESPEEPLRLYTTRGGLECDGPRGSSVLPGADAAPGKVSRLQARAPFAPGCIRHDRIIRVKSD